MGTGDVGAAGAFGTDVDLSLAGPAEAAVTGVTSGDFSEPRALISFAEGLDQGGAAKYSAGNGLSGSRLKIASNNLLSSGAW